MMKKMILILMVLAAFLFFSGCYQYSWTETREFTFPYSQQMELFLSNKVGDIHFQVWEEEEIYLEVQLTGRANSESLAQKMVDESTILLNPTEQGLEVKSEPYSHQDAALRMDYVVKIPLDFNCTVQTSVGDIHIQRMKGDLSATTGTGSIFVDSLTGNIQVQGGTGDIHLGTAEGDLNVSTSTGDIRIDYARGEVQRLETSTGSITATLEIPKYTENRIQSSTGDIVLFLRGDLSSQLWVGVGTGEISLEGLELRLEEREDNLVIGVLGTGEAHLRIQSSTGDIRLVRD